MTKSDQTALILRKIESKGFTLDAVSEDVRNLVQLSICHVIGGAVMDPTDGIYDAPGH